MWHGEGSLSSLSVEEVWQPHEVVVIILHLALTSHVILPKRLGVD